MDEDKIVVFLYEPPAGSVPVPAEASTPILFFSGEWGYTPLHQDASCDLATKGRYVLGIDSSEYFKKMLPGASLAKDLALFRATLNEGAGRPKDAPVIVAGFSWGSGLVPYLLNRAGTQGVAGALLIAPGRNGQAVFRAAVKLKMAVPDEEAFDVGREMARLPPIPVVLMQGTLDDQADAKGLLPSLRGARLLAPIVGGDHQFHEVRDVFFDQASRALRWIETQAKLPGASAGPSVSADPSAPTPSAPKAPEPAQPPAPTASPAPRR